MLLINEALRTTLVASGLKSTFDTGTLELFDGVMPIVPGGPHSAKLLGAFDLSDQFFVAGAPGVTTKGGDLLATAVASGTSRWMRMTSGASMIEGTVGQGAAGKDWVIDATNVEVANGESLTVLGLALTLPVTNALRVNSLRLNLAARSLLPAVLAPIIDAAVIHIRTGEQPTDPELADTGTLLATGNSLSVTAVGADISLDFSVPMTAIAAGNASYAVVDGGVFKLTATVGELTGDFRLSQTGVKVGDEFMLTALNIHQPGE